VAAAIVSLLALYCCPAHKGAGPSRIHQLHRLNAPTHHHHHHHRRERYNGALAEGERALAPIHEELRALEGGEGLEPLDLAPIIDK